MFNLEIFGMKLILFYIFFEGHGTESVETEKGIR